MGYSFAGSTGLTTGKWGIGVWREKIKIFGKILNCVDR
jgi:hypothetical protein